MAATVNFTNEERESLIDRTVSTVDAFILLANHCSTDLLSRRDGRPAAVEEALVQARALALGFGPVQRVERLETLDLHYHARVARWLYHGLHSWDFEPLLSRHPLWDVLMLTATTLGTALSVTSVVIAWRRVNAMRSRAAARDLSSPLIQSLPHRSLP